MNYPHCQPNLDEDGSPNTDNYIYVFSLLLHYACVKSPNERIQKMCNHLKDQSQQSIAVFFTMLLNQKIIDKEILVNAMSEAGGVKAELLSPEKSGSSGGSSGQCSRFTFSPPTPRTKLLNDWNSENKQLKVSY